MKPALQLYGVRVTGQRDWISGGKSLQEADANPVERPCQIAPFAKGAAKSDSPESRIPALKAPDRPAPR